MQKVDFIVFSKNRAMQLRALLESFFHFVDIQVINSVSVIHHFDPNYREGYQQLYDEFAQVNFIHENDFKEQTLSVLRSSSEFVCFLVDDIIFFREVKGEIIPKQSEVCFTLRLGENCKYSHPANAWYNPPKFSVEDGFISWEWNSAEYDFGYPFSLDGHVFRKDDILTICEDSYFRSPNSLENVLVYFNPHMQRFSSMRMRSFKHSSLVGVPVNRVNNEVPNRFGLEYGISEKELQNIFNQRMRISWEEMDFSSIQGPHKEICYQFKEL